ncbi:MAG: hypothetical protein OHM77_01730 [Candidatus Nitricoxidivorans perseverans]|uniref:Circularly permuted type 2 ATP-grasp protein n=1 Tax=Candidatus Nitricoxidivorans perseverans TaxID=2975601 RepID=A0AA49FM49_9PROT|nr:MAG: hypothetical protein OHM77_01730 [Candidatus Nitricoxidivorans perseverans]
MEFPASLFSDVTVTVAADDLGRMAALIVAIERVVALPAWRDHVLAWAPEAARHESAARSVFFGYDFHETPEGPKLIEINTNAGGGLLCAWREGGEEREALQSAFVDMFRAEWRAERGDAPLRAIAIVDEAPADQFLYPEFLLFRDLFERHGITAVVCDPSDLMLCHGGLWFEETRIDLVYNRLTDFALAEDAHAALSQSWRDGAAVVTPNPRLHALYADKRNLVALSDDALLAGWGVDAETRAVLAAGVPRTELVAPDRADDLWARRRRLFFKPAAGYGAKAAWRGDKMTRRVFDEVLAGRYVAQAMVPPPTRNIAVDGGAAELKCDLRCYAYDGRIQSVAARLWQGQTTNFRTPGGGFARVVIA